MPTCPANHATTTAKPHSTNQWGKGRGGRPWRRKRLAVAKRDKYQCQDCHRAAPNGQADHIKPLSQGGTDDMDNLQWLCIDCHKAKTAKESGGKPKGTIELDGYPRGGVR